MGHVTRWWTNYLIDHRLRRLFHRPAAVLGPYLVEGGIALDVGCGLGYFSIAMAEMVGPAGRVIAADIYPQALDVLVRRARRRGVAGRIRPLLCPRDQVGVGETVDFIVAFWMAHEAPDLDGFFREMAGSLKPEGRFLLVEPIFHVPKRRFAGMLERAEEAGLEIVERPRVRFGHAAVLRRAAPKEAAVGERAEDSSGRGASEAN